MSKESVQFSEMIRNPQIQLMPAETKLWLWCLICGEHNAHRLAYETELDEIYRCPDCGNSQSFRVR